MTTVYKKIVNQLKEILEKNRDAEKGYAKAAENAKSTNVQTYFIQKSEERQEFASALNRELIIHYDGIQTNGTFSGEVHRAWMDFKTSFSRNTDEAMIEEAIRADQAAIDEYTKVLEDDLLPASLAILIRDQLLKIRAEINHIKTLEKLG